MAQAEGLHWPGSEERGLSPDRAPLALPGTSGPESVRVFIVLVFFFVLLLLPILIFVFVFVSQCIKGFAYRCGEFFTGALRSISAL